MLRRVLAIGLTIATIGGAGYAIRGRGTVRTGHYFINHARLEIPVDRYDRGDIQVGTTVSQVFTIHNAGNETLSIFEVTPSCGCMVTSLRDTAVPPNGTTQLTVQIKTDGKGPGHIVKTVKLHTSASRDSVHELTITATLFDSTFRHSTAHAGGVMRLQGIFTGSCAHCHVERGSGKHGQALYEADCAVCHGSNSEGKPAPSLQEIRLRKWPDHVLDSIVRGGVPGTNMPAFGREHRGPLEDDDLISVVRFLHTAQ